MEFDKECDARNLNCPLPILRCKKSLSEIESAQILKIMATDPGAVKDFQAFGGPVILCCASGNRSGQATYFLQSQGMDSVYNGGSWLDVNYFSNAK